MTFVLAVLGAFADVTASILQRKAAGDEPSMGMVRLLRSAYLQGEATGESSDGC